MRFPKDHMSELGYCEFDEYKIIEEEEWVCEGKYDYRSIIFEYNGKTYCLSQSRAGSYHSGYEYYLDNEIGDEVECPEVEKVEKISYEWRVVNG